MTAGGEPHTAALQAIPQKPIERHIAVQEKEGKQDAENRENERILCSSHLLLSSFSFAL
jgi:hypothetical protein